MQLSGDDTLQAARLLLYQVYQDFEAEIKRRTLALSRLNILHSKIEVFFAGKMLKQLRIEFSY